MVGQGCFLGGSRGCRCLASRQGLPRGGESCEATGLGHLCGALTQGLRPAEKLWLRVCAGCWRPRVALLREPGTPAGWGLSGRGWQSHRQLCGVRNPCRRWQAHHGLQGYREQPLCREDPGDGQRGAGCRGRAQGWRQAERLDRQLNGAGGRGQKGGHFRQALLPGRGRDLRLSKSTQRAARRNRARGPGGSRAEGKGMQSRGLLILGWRPGA